MNPMLAQLFASQPGLLSMLQQMQPTSMQPQQPQQSVAPLPGLLTQAGYMNGQFGPDNAGKATMGPQPNFTGNLSGPPTGGLQVPPGGTVFGKTPLPSAPVASNIQERPRWIDEALNSGYHMQERQAMEWMRLNKEGKAPPLVDGGYHVPNATLDGGRRGGGRGG